MVYQEQRQWEPAARSYLTALELYMTRGSLHPDHVVITLRTTKRLLEDPETGGGLVQARTDYDALLERFPALAELDAELGSDD